jgi:hypothetical protein
LLPEGVKGACGFIEALGWPIRIGQPARPRITDQVGGTGKAAYDNLNYVGRVSRARVFGHNCRLSDAADSAKRECAEDPISSRLENEIKI